MMMTLNGIPVKRLEIIHGIQEWLQFSEDLPPLKGLKDNDKWVCRFAKTHLLHFRKRKIAAKIKVNGKLVCELISGFILSIEEIESWIDVVIIPINFRPSPSRVASSQR